jgi:Putative addiction module component
MLIEDSHIQYLHDSKGKPTAVQIPIKDWKNIEKKVLNAPDVEIPQWHKKLLDKRIKRAKEHPESMLDFDIVMKQLENEI